MRIVLFVALCSANLLARDKYSWWESFGGGPENIHYSSLKQINKGNVHQLKIAWTFDSGDAFEESNIQCNPIVVDGVLYATTPTLRVISLNAATHYDSKFRAFDKLTGKLLWETILPFAGNATPATYQVKGRQYVVIAAGGGRGRPSGAKYIAFTLP